MEKYARILAIVGFYCLQTIVVLADVKSDGLRVCEGRNLTAIDFPVGGLGGSVIRLDGQARRKWWHIFNNFEERPGTGFVPNSFFAIRAQQGDSTVVRALQTVPEGPFEAMQSLKFRCAFPFAWYDFADEQLPVSVSLEAYSFLIPMDLKNSAIPSAVFRYTVKNTSGSPVKVSLLAAQQNAVGFNGYTPVYGPNNRQHAGYGTNKNRVVEMGGRTVLQMTGVAGSMVLSTGETGMTASAAWNDLATLHDGFEKNGQIAGAAEAASPIAGETVDGALAKEFDLKAGEERALSFLLSWHIPKGTFGRSDIPVWYFPEGGCQYENWWRDAMAVDEYVTANFKQLDDKTRLYQASLYGSNVPGYVVDRIAANIAVLKSPTAFWTKSGYFGLWESASDHEEWFGNCKHVYHYAQGHARLFPELGRLLRRIDLKAMSPDGLFTSRDGEPNNAIDGHFGTILGVYREHLLSSDDTFLKSAWETTRKGMDYAIATYDKDQDGMLSGSYHNTLDCNVSGTSPWIGSLYIAALDASARMAGIVGDSEAAKRYAALAQTARVKQDAELWDEKLGYYKEKTENLPGTRLIGDAVSIDMVLGQWWANQLGLGQIYPIERTRAGLRKIHEKNCFTDVHGTYPTGFRDFLGKGDTGWMMFVYPGAIPSNPILYHDEVMSGFEYSAAVAMIQNGLVQEGLGIIKAIHDRYDGRLRAQGEVHMANNSTVFGTGSPVGEDECGDFYGRAMSSWSALLALQGFQYDGPRGSITFKPVWKPEDHSSFFTAAEGWGVFAQSRKEGVQTERIELKYGRLTLRELVFDVPSRHDGGAVIVKNGGVLVSAKIAFSGNELRIALNQAIKMKAGDKLVVEFQ